MFYAVHNIPPLQPAYPLCKSQFCAILQAVKLQSFLLLKRVWKQINTAVKLLKQPFCSRVRLFIFEKYKRHLLSSQKSFWWNKQKCRKDVYSMLLLFLTQLTRQGLKTVYDYVLVALLFYVFTLWSYSQLSIFSVYCFLNQLCPLQVYPEMEFLDISLTKDSSLLLHLFTVSSPGG